MNVDLDNISDEFEGQGHRSRLKVMGQGQGCMGLPGGVTRRRFHFKVLPKEGGHFLAYSRG